LGWNTIGVSWHGATGERTFIDGGVQFFIDGNSLAVETKIAPGFYCVTGADTDLMIGYQMDGQKRINPLYGAVYILSIFDQFIYNNQCSEGLRIHTLIRSYCE
jgi:hypothetical protein